MNMLIILWADFGESLMWTSGWFAEPYDILLEAS